MQLDNQVSILCSMKPGMTSISTMTLTGLIANHFHHFFATGTSKKWTLEECVYSQALWQLLLQHLFQDAATAAFDHAFRYIFWI